MTNEKSTTQSMVNLFENELETHDQNPIDNNLNTINNDIKQINFENFIDDIALWPSSITDNFRIFHTLSSKSKYSSYRRVQDIG